MADDSSTQAILYVFDSLRRDAVGCYDGFVRTPHIDSVAADGVTFDQAMSQGIWTVPSSGSVFTGLYPDAHQGTQFESPLDSGLPRITDGLSDQGVTTACFSTINAVSRERGYDKGFDEFYQLGGNGAGLQPDIQDQLHNQLHPWIREHADTDFFVLVWSLGTHHPYQTLEMDDDHGEISGDQETMRRLPASEAEAVKEKYAETVTYCDEIFGDLVKLLKNEGIYEDVLFFITSDHGEVFDEHARLEITSSVSKILAPIIPGRLKRYYGMFNRSAFIGHQGIVPYDELLRVPLIIKPADGTFDESVETQVELIDIAPTVQRKFGRIPEEMQGVDLQQTLAGDSEPRRYTFSASQVSGGYLTYRSIATTEHKLVSLDFEYPSVSELADSRVLESLFAYSLAKNPVLVSRTSGEQEQVDDERLSTELQSALSEQIEESEQLYNRLADQEGTIALGEETKEHLRDLGYRQ